MLPQFGCRTSELDAVLQAMFKVSPCAAIAVLYVFTPEQWSSLLDGSAHRALLREVGRKAGDALSLSGKVLVHDREDMTVDVFLKLLEGRFLESYDPSRGCPAPYLMRFAFYYALTLARPIRRHERRTVPLLDGSGTEAHLDAWG